MSESKFTGGCACGAIRYDVSGEPSAMFRCHCRDCQRAGGGAFSPVVYFPRAKFRLLSGSLKHYHTPSLSGGENKRGFCPECGSRISGGESDDGIGIMASSLDDPSQFTPKTDIFTADVQPWDFLDPDATKFGLYPS
jgi:hypothetical protein